MISLISDLERVITVANGQEMYWAKEPMRLQARDRIDETSHRQTFPKCLMTGKCNQDDLVTGLDNQSRDTLFRQG
jgi:hypothetical protein